MQQKEGLRLRFPRAAQIRHSKEYARVYRRGVRVRGRWILLVAAPAEQPPTARIGLSVGRKFHKSAVFRNRTRRILREAFRLCRPQAPALDMILIPVGKEDFWKLAPVQEELQQLMGKAVKKLSS
ncbi:MAG: ribonuclease P protein component [Planctomycetota bacterium]|nr:ribonuclease P protein component [Planctomycetota bacterium]